jgi:hypothetical protein
LDHQPQLDAAPPDPHREEARDDGVGARLLISAFSGWQWQLEREAESIASGRIACRLRSRLAISLIDRPLTRSSNQQYARATALTSD